MSEHRAMIGHNQTPTKDAALADVCEITIPLTQRRDIFAADMNKRPVRSIDEARDAGDVIALARAARSNLEERRKAISGPLREAADAVGAHVAVFWESVDQAAELLQERIDVWGRSNRALIAAQQEEQQRSDAALREKMGTPAPSAPVLTPSKYKRLAIKGDMGGSIREVERKQFIVTDIYEVPRFILDSPIVHEAVNRVARDLAKHMPAIPGIQIKTHISYEGR